MHWWSLILRAFATGSIFGRDRLTLETHVQYKRKPAQCQFTTVLGVTKTRGFLHPDQNVLNATQNNLCRAVN